MSNLLKDFTTLGIGGPAEDVIPASSETELIKILNSSLITHHSSLIIGGGSNLLVSDQGFPGIIIKNEIQGLSRQGNQITAKSGTPLQELVNFSIKEGLSGLQKLTGIPGSVGGAIFGNAGAYGQTISDHLISIKSLTPQTSPTTLAKDQCNFSYRSSIFKQNHQIILEATFELTPQDPQTLQQEAAETLEKRLKKYPPAIKCPGSFFKNIVAQDLPPEILQKIPQDKIIFDKIPAGSLLEEVGAKGDQLGDIEIAPYHANLFINKGHGTAEDFYSLAKKYHDKVKEKYGISLEPEVQLINLPPLD